MNKIILAIQDGGVWMAPILLAFGVLQSAFGYFTLNRLFVHNRANFAFSVSSIGSKKVNVVESSEDSSMNGSEKKRK